MSLEYLVDRAIQYILVEVLETFINNTSNYLTKLVSLFKLINLKSYKSLPSQIDVLYKSKHFLVINKPPDILINSNDYSKSTVQTILRKQLPALTNPNLRHEFYFAHRLDYSTSGILCIPLNKQACASLSKSFELQKCQKLYIAVVNGHINEQEIRIIKLAIGEDIRYENTSKKMCTEQLEEFCKNPRRSETRLVTLSHGMYNERSVSKVLIQPVTGRRHQLRLHCSSIGHPILGDYTYGSEEDQKMPRMYLHAIRINAPNDSENLLIETDDPFVNNEFNFDRNLLSQSDAIDLLINIKENKSYVTNIT